MSSKDTLQTRLLACVVAWVTLGLAACATVKDETGITGSTAAQPTTAASPVERAPATAAPTSKAPPQVEPIKGAPVVPAAPASSPAARPVAPSAPPKNLPPNTFHVTAMQKDSTHPFFGTGSKLGFAINGVQGKPLIFVRGKTYTFKVDTGIKHDFYLATAAVGWGTGTYTHGVKGNFTYDGVVTITPDATTPDTLYYVCRNHKYMGGVIHVVNPGEEGKVDLSAPPAAVRAGAATAAAAATVSANEVKQKLAFADMYLGQSETANRIKGSGNDEAIGLYRQAQDQLAQAHARLDAGSPGDALPLVDEALRLMTSAAGLAPKVSQQEVQRARYKELLDGVRTYEASYQRNFAIMAKQKGGAKLRRIDLDAIHAATVAAQRLADDGNYDEANERLTEAQTTLTTALTELLHQQTMSYELVFDTPKEEYEYELSRYESYEELIPLAIEQKRPPEQTMKLVDQFVTKAKGIKTQSDPVAASGNYPQAILMLQGATSHIERALNLMGVR